MSVAARDNADKTTEERSPFGEAWQRYVRETAFSTATRHEQALLRIAFASGWDAATKFLRGDA